MKPNLQKKYLNFTGGSVKGIKMMGVAHALSEKYTFDVIAGLSVTAITSVLVALKRFDIIEEAMLSFTKKNMFGKFSPFYGQTLIPTIRAIGRVIFGKESMGRQDELVNTIKSYMTEELFNEWKYNCTTDVYIYAFCIEDNEIEEFNLKMYEYDEAINLMIASSNIPLLINSVEINGKHYCDVGFFRANASNYILRKHKNIKQFVSVYNREDSKKKFPFFNKFLKDAMPFIKQKEYYASKECERYEEDFCKANDIEYTCIPIGNVETDSIYDAGTKEEKKKDYLSGYRLGRKYKL